MSRKSMSRNWSRSGRTALFALPLLLLAAGAAAPAPDPPQSSAPWAPPATTLPPEFVAAAKTLFWEGLADPRGGEYRAITVQASGPFPGQTNAEPIHGWVLPAGPGESPKFAVCWDGQVYPVTAAGARADLQADAGAMAHGRAGNSGPLDGTALLTTAPSALKACLLLRLGEARLAEQVWAAQAAMPQPFWASQSATPQSKDLSLRLADDWTWGVFRRFLDARQQCDDVLALSLARRLARIRARAQGDAAERHLPPPYLPALAPLTDLLADEEVRARTPRPRPRRDGRGKSVRRQERLHRSPDRRSGPGPGRRVGGLQTRGAGGPHRRGAGGSGRRCRRAADPRGRHRHPPAASGGGKPLPAPGLPDSRFPCRV